jgi:hypothetical protein
MNRNSWRSAGNRVAIGFAVWAGIAFGAGAPATSAKLVVAQNDTAMAARDGGTLAGVIQYGGGFQDGMELKLSQPATVKYFRVDVPSFCGEVDILQAKTETEGVYDNATQVATTKNTFSVNGGAGERIGTISLTLNGPTTSSCAIPVYLLDSPDQSGDSTGLSGNFRDVNGLLGMVIDSSLRMTYLDLRVQLSTGLTGIGLNVPAQFVAGANGSYTAASSYAESFLVGALAVTCQVPVTLTATLDSTGNQLTLIATYATVVTVDAYYQCLETNVVNQSFVYSRE